MCCFVLSRLVLRRRVRSELVWSLGLVFSGLDWAGVDWTGLSGLIFSYRIVLYVSPRLVSFFVQNLQPMVWHAYLVMVSFVFLTVTMGAPYWTKGDVLGTG